MTISSQVRKAGPFTGNDSTTVFPFAFKVFSAADLYVVRTDMGIGLDSVLVLSSDYTVALNADQNANPGGSVTLSGALATGFTLTVTSSLEYLQPTDLTNQGGFYPSVINNALDRLTIFCQQLFDAVNRSLKISVSTPDGVNTTLPPPSANKLLGWNEDADGLQNVDASSLSTLVAFGTANADKFSGDGATTQFSLSANPGALNNLDVSVGGVTQRPGIDYTWASGTIITFTTAPPIGTNNVLVRYMQGLPQGYTDASLVSYNGSTVKAVLDAQRIANFAALSTASASIGQRVKILCHTFTGYGGGDFDVVSASGQVADGGYVAISGSIAFVRVDDYANGINIENYGAKRVCANSSDATLNSTAFLKALTKANAVGTYVFLPLVYDINRLGALPYCVRCQGADRNVSGLRVYWDGVSTHPYSGNPTPFMSSTLGAAFKRMQFDQQWEYATTPLPGGYNDGAFAATWGGYWFGEFNTANVVEFEGVLFQKTVRGFLTVGSEVKARNVYGDTLSSSAQCLIAGDSSASYLLTDCEVIGPRWDVEPLFGGFPVAGNSAFFGHDVKDLTIDNLIMEGHQLVFRGATKGGNSKRAVVNGVRLLSPVADTAFYFWDDLTISNVNIAFSGDMGLALESNRRMTVGNININGTHIGGIAINDGEYISCTGPISIWNIAQNYSRIKLFNRLASAAGPWLSLLSVSFKSGAAAGVHNLISSITAGFDTIPEVSDSNGPVRANVFGVFVEPTVSATTHTYSVNGVRVPDYRGSGLTSFMIFAPEHRFYLAPASRTGTPVLGEKFSNGANSFIYLSDFGDGNYVNIKRLVGTIPSTTTFTGATSGATLTSAALPQLEWLKVVATGNYDYTTEGPDGR